MAATDPEDKAAEPKNPDARSSVRGVLDLVEYIVFQVDAAGHLTPRGAPAAAFFERLPQGVDAIPALFGVSSAEALATRAREAHDLLADVETTEGIVPLKWGLFVIDTPDGPTIDCVSANWSPLLQMVRTFEQETLLFKELALNIFPRHIADELVDKRAVRPRAYRHATILFTDVVGFSRLAFHIDPVTLVRTLNAQFTAFDELMDDYGMEKIKTIGDAYMCVSGVPVKKTSHAVDAALAALEMVRTVLDSRQPPREVGGLDLANWQIRVGLHTGPCITGVVGHKKHVYDVWGDSVNIAARMESGSQPMRINISSVTYDEISEFFACTRRGSQAVKNIGDVDMWFLDRLLPEYSQDERGMVPNDAFHAVYVDRFRVRRGPLSAYPRSVRDYLSRV